MIDKKVKEYIEKQKLPEKEILKRARKLILQTFPDTNERFAYGIIEFQKGKFYLAALKDRVHIGFSIKGLAKEELKLFEGSGKTARHIKLYSVKDIEGKGIARILKMVDKKVVME